MQLLLKAYLLLLVKDTPVTKSKSTASCKNIESPDENVTFIIVRRKN